MSSNVVCPKRSRRVYSSREVVKHENNNNEIVEDALKTNRGLKQRVFRRHKMRTKVMGI